MGGEVPLRIPCRSLWKGFTMSEANLTFEVARLIEIRFHRSHVVVSLETTDQGSVDLKMSLRILREIEMQVGGHYEKLWTQ